MLSHKGWSVSQVMEHRASDGVLSNKRWSISGLMECVISD